MRVFIFGIGGTGSRVLRSLTMLLASGVKLGKNNDSVTIIPIVIDTDAHNGDTERTRDLIRSYNTIRKNFVNKDTNSQSDSFFNTQFNSFNRLGANSDESELDVQLNFQNSDNTFANFINYNALNQDNKDLIELFYNDSLDDYPELNLNLSVGFKGNPNIGSVVFNDLKFSEQFRNLVNSYTSADDRVFIISSIFGGTGSAGFPTLVKLIRSSGNPVLEKTKIGAITVMPYFTVKQKDGSAINSSIFDTKTKAALSFYSGDESIKSVNALYYISDNKETGEGLPNVEGGKEQLNNGHIIELISATSIIDFINKEDNDLKTPSCYEFGAEVNGHPFTIANFTQDTKEKYIKPLVKFAYASKIAKDFIPTLSQETFYGPKELNIANSLGIQGGYNKLLEFFADFQKWSAVEMSSPQNGRAFNSFNFEAKDHLNNMVFGKPIKTSFLNNGLSKKTISAKLTKNLLKEAAARPIPEKYISMLHETADNCITEFGDLP